MRHFQSNPKAGVTFYAGSDSVTLTANMEIVTDKAVKDGLWCDLLAQHFPNGGKDDPEYCILHFTASEATVYIDGDFKTLAV